MDRIVLIAWQTASQLICTTLLTIPIHPGQIPPHQFSPRPTASLQYSNPYDPRRPAPSQPVHDTIDITRRGGLGRMNGGENGGEQMMHRNISKSESCNKRIGIIASGCGSRIFSSFTEIIFLYFRRLIIIPNFRTRDVASHHVFTAVDGCRCTAVKWSLSRHVARIPVCLYKITGTEMESGVLFIIARRSTARSTARSPIACRPARAVTGCKPAIYILHACCKLSLVGYTKDAVSMYVCMVADGGLLLRLRGSARPPLAAAGAAAIVVVVDSVSDDAEWST